MFTACNCDTYGSQSLSCNQETGQCNCSYTFEGLMCDKCKPNFYNYPICEGTVAWCFYAWKALLKLVKSTVRPGQRVLLYYVDFDITQSGIGSTTGDYYRKCNI